MKFLCSNCKAKYQIADEKVAGRTLRMTCRQCKQEIVIRGDAPAVRMHAQPSGPITSAGAPSPLAADFHRQLGASTRPSLPMPPPLMDAWHVAINDVPVGPMRREDVARRVASGAVGPESLAWREGLDDWLPMRQIPELAALLGSAAPAPVPFMPAMPAQRANLAPVGGRAGAAPAFSLEDWAPPPPAGASLHAPRSSAVAAEHEVGRERSSDRDAERGPRMPSWGAMFAIACGFAFLMSVLAIGGARWLSSNEPAVVASTPATEGTAPANTEREAPSAVKTVDEPAEMVVELDDIPLEAEAKSGTSSTTRPATTASTTAAKPKTPAATTKSTLTDAEKAMLERMGGGSQPKLADINTSSATANRTSTGGSGGLNAQQLSAVVMQGRKNLQRCYETAARGSTSGDTIRLDVEITVSPSGNVTAVKTGDGGLPGLRDCVQKTVKMWRFPTAGESTQTKFPLVFQPGA